MSLSLQAAFITRSKLWLKTRELELRTEERH